MRGEGIVLPAEGSQLKRSLLRTVKVMGEGAILISFTQMRPWASFFGEKETPRAVSQLKHRCNYQQNHLGRQIEVAEQSYNGDDIDE